MKAKTVRKFIITESIVIIITIMTSIYGYLDNNLNLTFVSSLIACYCFACIIDDLCEIIKANSGMTIWDHLRELINKNEKLP